MVVFPHAKINLGLNILRRRPDGYHDIDSVMYHIAWCDILEIVPAKDRHDTTLTCRGIETLDCADNDNLVLKAYRAVKKHIDIPAVDIYLQKNIPSGAGLGGGSADAAYTVRALDTLFDLGLSRDEMAAIVAPIGADCPFFIYDSPMTASDTGTVLTPTTVPYLAGKTLVVCRPDDCHISTAQAYAGVKKDPTATPTTTVVQQPVAQWREQLHNMFEDTVFPLFPAIAALKERFYAAGATYAAMSGSGAAVYAVFEDRRKADEAYNALTYKYKFIQTL